MFRGIVNRLKLVKPTYSVNIMPAQSKISTFLKPLQPKRTSEGGSDEQIPSKKVKISTEKKEANIENEENVSSPDQKKDNSGKDSFVVDMGRSWSEALKPQFSKPYFLKLSRFVEAERQKHTIYPPHSQVWSWTQMTDIRDVKVVILGQDPYHGPNQAHGLCFSVQNGVRPPPSLLNMYKALEADIPDFARPDHGVLTGWAKQGVLLLNAVLTVQSHQANSHKDKGWEQLTDAVISWLNNNLEGIVFMLWGSYAQKKGACINKKKHHILHAVHPSPLSAHRGFFDCKHFSKCNKLLQDQGKTPIDWNHLPA